MVHGTLQTTCRHIFDDMCDVEIVRLPEGQYFFPRSRIVILYINPGHLFIRKEIRVFRILRADEALMVIGSGIYQVTQNFLSRPFVRRRFLRCFCFIEIFKTCCKIFHCLSDPTRNLCRNG